MLALQTGMDAVRSSTACSSIGLGLPRQPSAEDLDAARQLVSSARGGRSNGYADEENGLAILPGERTNGRDVGFAGACEADSQLSGEAPVGLGQTCRYFPKITHTIHPAARLHLLSLGFTS